LTFIQDAKEYIKGLTDDKGLPLIKSSRKTPFVGFLLAISSIQGLYEDLVKSKKLKYLCTYKLSQDHLELFFSSIRASLGFNNNPTAGQLEASFKRLLINNEIQSLNGNCIPQDDTQILFITSSRTSETTVADCDIDKMLSYFDLIPKLPMSTDHDYCDVPQFSPHLSDFKEAVIGYMAGFVVQRLLKNIKCTECREALVSTTKCYGNLASVIFHKDNGGLIYPSEGVYKVCVETEKCILRILNSSGNSLPNTANYSKAVVTAVLNNFHCQSKSVFDSLNVHSMNMSLSESHAVNLIRLLSENYCKIRFHHIAKGITEDAQGEYIRRSLSKMILFKNQ
jgi:hypothetical protein